MDHASDSEILKAVEILKNGGVVGMPTETVYGLAADIKNPAGIENIFKTKKRPFFDPLIVHIAHLIQLKSVVTEFSDLPQFLGEKFWPGPLTMILPKSKFVNPKITSGLETVGVRFPQHPVAQKLIHKLGNPIAAPSANLFGKTSPTTAAHVKKEFKDKVMVLDGGTCEVGLESTVIGFDDNYLSVKIYRPGSITKEILETALKGYSKKISVIEEESPVSPGHLKHHYMPTIPLAIIKDHELDDPMFKQELMTKLKLTEFKPIELVLHNDATIAARELYQNLRRSSEAGATFIFVREKNEYQNNLWTAIWDRLQKAASLKLD
jgi:L-threonylcarbamoyladenylate synthase